MSARDVIATQRCKHATMEWIDPPCDRCRKETDNFFDTAAVAGFAIVPRDEVARLRQARDQIGDAICDVIEQMLKGDWQDDLGHPVSNNTSMIRLKDALNELSRRKALEAKHD